MKFYHLIGLSFVLGVLEFFLIETLTLSYFIRLLFFVTQGILFLVYFFLCVTYLIVRNHRRRKKRYYRKSHSKYPEECL